MPLDRSQSGSRYSGAFSAFVLILLLVANTLNYADRSILSVLAEPIRHDLKITNAQVGFLAGTSFVLFNGIIGLVMGHVMDLWRRNRLLMIGVALWSTATALSGFATSFVQLSLARVGLGVGETTIGAGGYSLLADIFPPRRRATAFAIFLCGPFVGLALSMAIGGWVVQHWSGQCGGLGLCWIRGWQAAFLVFGLPGAIVAVVIGLVGEPASGEAALRRARSRPLAEAVRELSFMAPPFSVFQLARSAGGSAVRLNLLLAGCIIAAVGASCWVTHDVAQWVAVGIGFYTLLSWFQALAYRDPETFRLTAGSPAFRAIIISSVVVSTVYGGVSFWSVPLAIRKLGMSYAEVGVLLGAANGFGSLTGNILGGIVADHWGRRTKSAALYMSLISLCGGAVTLPLVLESTNKAAFSVSLGAFAAIMAIWPPGINALLQELVTPRMRGRTAAIYVVTLPLISGLFGPYAIGKIADATGSVQAGLSALFVVMPFGLIALLLAFRRLPGALASREGVVETAPI